VALGARAFQPASERGGHDCCGIKPECLSAEVVLVKDIESLDARGGKDRPSGS
jgi:hypothetical protein